MKKTTYKLFSEILVGAIAVGGVPQEIVDTNEDVQDLVSIEEDLTDSTSEQSSSTTEDFTKEVENPNNSTEENILELDETQLNALIQVTLVNNYDYVDNDKKVFYTRDENALSLEFDFSNVINAGYKVNFIKLKAGNKSLMSNLLNYNNKFVITNVDTLGNLYNSDILYEIEYQGVVKQITTKLFSLNNLVPQEAYEYKWVVDTENPEITNVSVLTPTREVNLKNEDNIDVYIANDKEVILKFNLKDNEGIKLVEVMLNDGIIEPNQTNENEYTCKVYLNEISKISISCKDIVGNTQEFTFSLNPFDDINSFSVEESKFSTFEGITYYEDKLNCKFNNWDKLSKEEKQFVGKLKIDNNGVIKDVKINKDGSFVLQEDIFTLWSDCGKSIEELSDSKITSTFIKDKGMPYTQIKKNNEIISYENLGILNTSDVLNLQVFDDTLLSSITLNVNDSDVFIQDNKLSEVDLPEISFNEDGQMIIGDIVVDLKNDNVFTCKLKATDILGNTINVDFNILLDYQAPNILFGTISTLYGYDESSVYILPETKIQGIKAEDDLGEVVELVLVGNKNNEFWEEDILNVEEFSILKDGFYYVKATDSNGNSRKVDLETLLGIKNGKEFKIDYDMPEIKPNAKTEEILSNCIDIDGNMWLNTHKNLVYSVTDSYLRDFSIEFINKPELVSSFKYNNDLVIVIQDNCYGELSYKITAYDCSGRMQELYNTIYIDTINPEIKGVELNSEYHEFGSNLYFKNTPYLNIKAEDLGSGIKEYKVNNISNDLGIFELSDGVCNIEVIDKVNHSSGLVPLSSLLGTTANNIIIDTISPTINTSRPQGDKDGWYTTDQMYIANITDDIGLKSAKIEINGVVVSSFEASEENITNTLLSGDTSVVSNESGIYNITIYAEDIAGNISTWSDTIRIDSTSPIIDKLVFTGDGYQDGVKDNSTGNYGFYFKGSPHCDVYVSDGKDSSGLKSLHLKLKYDSGKTEDTEIPISGGLASFDLPEGFKGFMELYPEDIMGNIGNIVKPDGTISETLEIAENSINISIDLPNTDKKDVHGIDLYGSNVVISSTIKSSYSGIRKIEWGVGNKTGIINVDNNGNATGDISSINTKNGNLILNLSKGMLADSNENNIKIWVRVTDRAGYTSDISKIISIDKSSPVISVNFNQTNSDNYYNSNRTATLKISDKNINPSNIDLKGNLGGSTGWSLGNDNCWYNTLSFSNDGDYEFNIICSDLAGNISNSYSCPKFTIDKTNPIISVSFDNNNNKGIFYKDARTATISIVERNFNPSSTKVEGISVGGWSNKGEIHTAVVPFNKNGKYSFSISTVDQAGNTSNSYTCSDFIIDLDKPIVSVTGINNGVSYKKDLNLTVDISDAYLDDKNILVTLKGKRNGNIPLESSFNSNSASFSLSNIPNEEKYDDIYTLSILASDMAGNIENRDYTFSVNRFGSAYSSKNEDIMGNYLNSKKSITILERNIDKIDLEKARVSVLLNGIEIKVPKNSISIKELPEENGKHVYEYLVNKDVFTEDGKYSIQIYSTTVNGDTYSSLSEEYTFVLDTANPDIIISGVESNTRYKDYKRDVTINAKDLSGIKCVNAELNGSSIDVEKEGDFYKLSILESGSVQNLVIHAEDMAGNVSTISIENFNISSNTWEWLINQLWFKIILSIPVVGGLLAGVFGISKKRKNNKV